MYKFMDSAHFPAVLGKKSLLLVLYSLDSYHKRPGYSAVVSLSDRTQQNTTRLQKRKCTITFRGYVNRDHVHILRAIRAVTTRNQTGPQPKSARRNPLPHSKFHEESRSEHGDIRE